jgi:hypothetical protein
MAYFIYLVCVAMNSVLMHHLDISITQWEHWASLTLIIISWICGREHQNKYNN